MERSIASCWGKTTRVRSGLHVPDVRTLQADLASLDLGDRASIEPGADELGTALVAHAIARAARWQPRIAVRRSHSRRRGVSRSDRVRADLQRHHRADRPLRWRDPTTPIPRSSSTCAFRIRRRWKTTRSNRPCAPTQRQAVPSHSPIFRSSQRTTTKAHSRGASSPRASQPSSTPTRLWNTNANTVGTALAEAVAAGAGRRTHAYDGLAHRTATFIRFLDDYAFHDLVRPDINATLTAQGIPDHTLLPPDVARATEERAPSVTLELRSANSISTRPRLPHRRTINQTPVGPNLRNRKPKPGEQRPIHSCARHDKRARKAGRLRTTALPIC